MRPFFFGLLWLLSGGPGYAQKPEGWVRRHPVFLKLSPLTLLDPNSTYQVAGEYLFSPRWSVQQELGYGNGRILFQNNNQRGNGLWTPVGQGQEVWRSRTEVRRYRNSGWDPDRGGRYLAAEVLLKRLNVPIEGNVGRECIGEDCAYFQRLRYRAGKDVYGFHLKIGKQILRNRWLFDSYFGLGLRQVYAAYRDLPGDGRVAPGEQVFSVSLDSVPTDNLRPSLTLGFKVGYAVGAGRTRETRE